MVIDEKRVPLVAAAAGGGEVARVVRVVELGKRGEIVVLKGIVVIYVVER